MKTISRKLLSALLCAAMLLSVVAGTAAFTFADEHDHDHEAHIEAETTAPANNEAETTAPANGSVETAAPVDGNITVTFENNKCKDGKYCLPLTITVTAPDGIKSVKVNGAEVAKDKENATEFIYTVMKADKDGKLTVEVQDQKNHSLKKEIETGAHKPGGRMTRVNRDATCTEAGYDAILCICTECGSEYLIVQSSTQPTGHDWKEATIKGCKDGAEIKVQECTKCGVVKVEDAANQHTWGPETTTPATCDEPGKTIKTCTVCGTTITVATTRALGHLTYYSDYEETPCAKIWTYKCMRPDCDYEYRQIADKGSGHNFVEGNDCTKPRTCSKCGMEDPNDTPETAHKWKAEWENDNENGHYHKCENSGCEQIGNFEPHQWKEGDCTQGLECAVCGYKSTTTGEHNFGGAWISDGEGKHYQKCQNPGCTATSEHTDCIGSDDNDCTTPVICTLCGAVKKAAQEHKLKTLGTTKFGHRMVCENEGCLYMSNFESHVPDEDCHDCTKALTCTVCGYVLRAAEKSHKYDSMWTGDENGHWQQCTHEGCTERRNEAKHDSNTSTSTIVSSTKPDCTHAGVKITSYFCKLCNAQIKVEREELPALGHSWGEWKTEKAATCEEDGIQKRTCERCGEEETKTLPKTGHSWGEWQTEKAATCEDAGTEKRTCNNCKKTETQTVAALGHNWKTEKQVDKEATCTAEGSKSTHCTRCDKTKDSETIPALGHKYGEWKTEKQATCTEAGTKKRTCERCGNAETEAIPATGHHYENGVCTNCGEKMPLTPYSGDVNGDGKIDLQDALLALRGVLGVAELTQDEIKACDMDKDGTPTMSDVLLIMRKYVLSQK